MEVDGVVVVFGMDNGGVEFGLPMLGTLKIEWEEDVAVEKVLRRTVGSWEG